MPDEKLKSENYENFGGRNRKSSAYLTGPREVFDILNLDYHLVGSLSRRPGSGPYIPASVPQGPITGVYEYNKLSGASYLIVTQAGVSGFITTNYWLINGQTFNGISPAYAASNYSTNPFVFQTFVDYLFAANGNEFFKWNGTSFSHVSLPSGTIDAFSIGNSIAAHPGTGATGIFTYAVGYLNERGYLGPAIDVAATDLSYSSPFNIGETFPLTPTKYAELDFNNPVPVGYGITARAIFRSDANLSQLYLIAFIGISQATFFDGITYSTALGNTFGLRPLQSTLAPEYLFFTLTPRLMELFNNQMFYGGFSGNLASTFYNSDIAEPEGIGATNFEEVRTNDGDYLSCFKTYNSQLMLGKTKSLHALRGDNPANFYLTDVSLAYGILSPRSAVVWNQRFWFLDEQGVCEYDGADVHIVSTNMEDIFARMNIPVAKDRSMVLHAKDRNEVWCAIPTDGASLCNTIVFYDYIADAWGLYQGFNPDALGIFYGTKTHPTIFFGESAQIHTLDSSLYRDNGRAMTTMVQFRFESPLGNSTTKMFRRLWTDISAVAGVTYNMVVNLFADHSTSAALSATFSQGIFQTRLEFGIMAKSLSVQEINSDNSPLTLNGYALAARFLRSL